MKKFFCLVFCIIIFTMLAACAIKNSDTDKTTSSAKVTKATDITSEASEQADKRRPKPSRPAKPKPTKESSATTKETLAEETLTEEAQTESTTTVAETDPTEANSYLYSSYAYLTSFDPAGNIASFTYFDMLRGDIAVAYLVEHMGYSLSDAQAYVADFADPEYVEHIADDILCEIKIDAVDITLICGLDGESQDFTPTLVTASDFVNIYEINPYALLTRFYYYIHADDGKAYHIEQVYSP